MAKKYLNFAGLEIYDEQIKAYIDGEIDSISSDTMFVNVTQTDGTYTADKAFAEVDNAISEGKKVVMKYNTNMQTNMLFVSAYLAGDTIIFSNTINLGVPMMSSLIWSSDETITNAGSSLVSSSNRTTVLSSSSTHSQYPSAKATVDYVNTQISSHNHDDLYYTQAQIDGMKFITTDDIDEICGGVTEEGLPSNDIDELMAQLEEV